MVIDASVRVDALEPVVLEGFLSVPGFSQDPDEANNADVLVIDVLPSENRVFGDGFEPLP